MEVRSLEIVEVCVGEIEKELNKRVKLLLCIYIIVLIVVFSLLFRI